MMFYMIACLRDEEDDTFHLDASEASERDELPDSETSDSKTAPVVSKPKPVSEEDESKKMAWCEERRIVNVPEGTTAAKEARIKLRDYCPTTAWCNENNDLCKRTICPFSMCQDCAWSTEQDHYRP